MHDIICPNCGERFLGYDTAFDISDRVFILIQNAIGNSSDNIRAVENAKFKFYLTENMILSANPELTSEKLRCPKIGPNQSSTLCSFRITRALIYEYLYQKSGAKTFDEFDEIIMNIAETVEERGIRNVNPLDLYKLEILYYTVFKSSNHNSGKMSIEDENVRIAIQIICYLYNNKNNVDDYIDLDIAIFSANANKREDYEIADILFVRNGLNFDKIYKSCPYCGRRLPEEFGYYKIMPVVLLGSHSSGKTSYLVSLYNTALYNPDFVECSTMSADSDDNLKPFQTNVERFQKGLAPRKTDFINIPILNLLVNDIIYSFIDWPGEKFIDESEERNAEFIYQSRRIMACAAHVMLFLPPQQVDLIMAETEERVVFQVPDLIGRLKTHLSFTGRLRSLTCVINKVDLLEGRPNAGMILEQINNVSEADIFNGEAWNEQNYKKLESVTEEYLKVQNLLLYRDLMKTAEEWNTELHCLPVKPYGFNAPDDNSDGNQQNQITILHGKLQGVPFLRILKTDRAI